MYTYIYIYMYIYIYIGIPIRSNLSDEDTENYAALVSQLAIKAHHVVRYSFKFIYLNMDTIIHISIYSYIFDFLI
jgi:predicted AlkP superfamily pyrophosphatase or phosphodiesterase